MTTAARTAGETNDSDIQVTVVIHRRPDSDQTRCPGDALTAVTTAIIRNVIAAVAGSGRGFFSQPQPP